MKISCGILIHNKIDFLVVRPTGSKTYYDIPKGLAEGDETWRETAVRELYEES